MNEAETKVATETINPATGMSLDHYENMNNEEVDEVNSKCHQAFLMWRGVSPEKRAEVIKAIGKNLMKNKEEQAQLITDEMGKTLVQSRHEVDLCAAIC